MTTSSQIDKDLATQMGDQGNVQDLMKRMKTFEVEFETMKLEFNKSKELIQNLMSQKNDLY